MIPIALLLPTVVRRLVLPAALLCVPVVAFAQAAGAASQGGAPPPDDQTASAPAPPQRFLETITVTATLNPVAIEDTPGSVSVIDAETIRRLLLETFADLVKFEPGVYVESNPTRVGLNGFNIRGIGGNRVLTRVDGVETAEQFDFGPFNVHQIGLDLDALQSAEIVRSASSSLYGSDALGGVVSLFTKDPADYLLGRPLHVGARVLYDSRAADAGGNVVIAGGRGRVQASAFASIASGHAPDTQGDVETEDATRTAPNPQDRRVAQGLGKVVYFTDRSRLRGAVEIADSHVETEVFSGRGPLVTGPIVTDITDIDAVDSLTRWRGSVDQTLFDRAGLDQMQWSLFVQRSDVGEVVDERRISTGAGPAATTARQGTLDYAQQSVGGSVQGRRTIGAGRRMVQLTAGGSHTRDRFDMLRDRIDLDADTGAEVPTSMILPTKYFPESVVSETGAYVQAEASFGRLTLVPGLRYDRFAVDADETDPVFLASLSPTPVDFSADAVSSRLGATLSVSDAVTLHTQYAAGFRAPPYSAVNSGFTNPLGGYTSLPNADLEPETSDAIDLGVRASLGRVDISATGFWSRYDDFIELVTAGFNPATGLLEFQNQNLSKVRITGVELQGEGRLTDRLRLRASYAVIRGDDVSGDEDVPLQSVAPDRGAVGLQYVAASTRWGSDVSVRFSSGRSRADVGEDQFAPDGYGVVDLTGWVRLTDAVALRGGLLNLMNATYFEWPNVRGRSAADPALDRYSSAGFNGILSLSYGW